MTPNTEANRHVCRAVVELPCASPIAQYHGCIAWGCDEHLPVMEFNLVLVPINFLVESQLQMQVGTLNKTQTGMPEANCNSSLN